MKRSIISTLATTVAVAATFALSACGTGMRSQTAEMVPAVAGVSADSPGAGDAKGYVALRNAALVYPGPQGYKSGSEVTVHAWLFNNTPQERTIVIKHEGQEIKRSTIKSGGFERTELKFKVNKDVPNGQWVDVQFDWIDFYTMDVQLPIAPPDALQPGEKVELPAEPGGEGH